MDPGTTVYVQGILIAAVPLVVFAIRKAIAKLPKSALPFVAIALGAGSSALLTLVDMSVGGPLVGAVLGAAGIGLREMVDQSGKALTPGPPELDK